MTSLIIAEHDNVHLKPASLSLITAGLQLGDSIDVLVAGHDCSAVVEALQGISGIGQILCADNTCYEHQLAESLAPLLVDLASNYAAILSAASTMGKNLLPRVAASLDVAQISEITKIVSSDTFVRPIYAGNAMATVQSNDNLKILTVRTSAFDAVATGVDGASTPVVNIETIFEQDKSLFVSEKLSDNQRPDLATANIVVSGGRGLGSAENFKIIEQLADKLGAAIGASRAAVDAGFVGNELQVGQTGQIVAPELYIAVGISGAIQHLAGMKDSKVIVAINKDADAPIFQVADYGLVEDLFKALPEIEALL